MLHLACQVPLSLSQLFQIALVAVAKNQKDAGDAKPAAEAKPDDTASLLESNPKYKQFIATLEKKGFFKGVTKGSPEEMARWEKARATFIAKYGAPEPSEAPVAPAAPAEELSEEERAKNWEEAEKCKGEGNDHLKKKEYDEAVAAYTRALELRPDYHIYLANRAAALTHLSRHSEAVTDCKRAIEVDPGYVKAYSRLGFAYYQLKQYTESVSAYERGLALDPNNTTMKQGMENAQHQLQVASSSGAAAGGLPGGLPGGLGGLMGQLGGNPDIAALMQNPAMMQMAQQMMSDPAAMSSMMEAMGPLMAQAGGAGGAPDPNAMAAQLQNNPQLRQMADQMAAQHPNLFAEANGAAGPPSGGTPPAQ